MKALLFDVCVNQRHTSPAFLALAEGGFSTDWLAATASDVELLDLARSLDRVLVTEDSDFGDLIFRDRHPPPVGVVLVQASLIPLAERQARLLVGAREALDVAEGHFVVVGRSRTRFRSMV